MGPLCARYARAMRALCARYARAMRALCARCARAMRALCAVEAVSQPTASRPTARPTRSQEGANKELPRSQQGTIMLPYDGQEVDFYMVFIDYARIFCGLRELHDPG